jgi:hypothetical protein
MVRVLKIVVQMPQSASKHKIILGGTVRQSYPLVALEKVNGKQHNHQTYTLI